MKLEIVDGVIEQMNYESHKRGKNWVATVERNLQAIGGLDRDFWKQRRQYATVPDDIAPGQWIELGGDYCSVWSWLGGGNASRNRKYFRVGVVSDEVLEVEEVQKGEIGKNDKPSNPLARYSDKDIRAEAARRGLL